MKRILLFVALLAPAASFAQTQAPAPAAAIDPANAHAEQANLKSALASKATELEASLTRNDATVSTKVLNEGMAIMQRSIALQNRTLQSPSKDQKAVEAERQLVSKKVNLYTEIKTMSVDLAKNHAAIVAKMKEFAGML